MIAPYEIINDEWEVQKKIGKGTFCELYVAHNIHNDTDVAVKVLNDDIQGPVFKWEAEVLKNLLGQDFVPQFIYHGKHKERDILIMEFLGEDMSMLRNRLRTLCPAIHIVPATYLAIQMLRCIKLFHNHGYIHRDIKPSNFVRSSRDSTSFHMVDFGIAKQYREKDGRIKEKRKVAEFRGTTMYASVNLHDNQDQAPRDDCWSLIYVYIDLICGKLPWTEVAKKGGEKDQVAALKREYTLNPEKFIEWIHSTITNVIQSQSIETKEVLLQFPVAVGVQLQQLMLYLLTLTYEDTPDYELVHKYFETMAAAPEFQNTSLSAVSESTYSYAGFDWSIGPEKDNSPPSIPVHHQLRILAAKARKLKHSVLKDTQDKKQKIDIIESVTPVLTIEDAKLWTVLAKELVEYIVTASTAVAGSMDAHRRISDRLKQLTLLENKKLRQLVEDIINDLRYVLLQWSWLWGCETGGNTNVTVQDSTQSNDQQWLEFMAVQEVVFDFSELRELVRSLPQEIISFSDRKRELLDGGNIEEGSKRRRM